MTASKNLYFIFINKQQGEEEEEREREVVRESSRVREEMDFKGCTYTGQMVLGKPFLLDT